MGYGINSLGSRRPTTQHHYHRHHALALAETTGLSHPNHLPADFSLTGDALSNTIFLAPRQPLLPPQTALNGTSSDA